jgi:RecB family exonuclease
MILDVLILDSSTEATIIDWKTGKSWMKDVSHMQQAQLYVAGVFRAFPDLETVTTRFVYTNERDKQTIRQFNRTQGEASRVAFHNRGGRMTTETKFAPKPSQRNCKYCDFGSQHGTKHCIYDVNREDAIRPRGGLTGQRRR